jgi:2-oxoglutarate ferredoxin oxidoreductase subunit alpha
VAASKPVEEIDRVAIRFAGDSGDGMQLTGTRFTEATALVGNDLATLPDFPAEIRAPAGTLAGVSAFQIHFASRDIRTPADHPDVLVAMNPAALRANAEDVRRGGMLIINSDAFTARNLKQAGYDDDPLPTLRERFRVVEIQLSKLTRKAVESVGLRAREAERSKNFFALGLMCWLYNRPTEPTERWIESRFEGNATLRDGNLLALQAGHAYGETTELFPVSFFVPRAKMEPGLYRNITGNQALAWGMIAASELMNRPLFLGAYPITPASSVLHEVSRYRHFGVKTFQAEDEIAAVASAIGASYAGMLGVTATSGPGFVLKQEALGLAVMVELPVVVLDVQRAGPATGMPTKTEQGDLLLALFGRTAESPMPVLAPSTPGDCFHTIIEAFHLAVKYMTPVAVLSDGYLANAAEPWRIPDVETLKRRPVRLRTDPEGFAPYLRDEDTLARPWAIPGTPGLEHRIGGLESEERTGNVSYDPRNHDRMVRQRTEKVARVANDIPPVEVNGPDGGKLVVVGWGGTRGAIEAAVEQSRKAGAPVSSIHLRYLNPLPADLGEALARFECVLVPELNLGQLARLLRAEYLLPVESLTKVTGQPFRVGEIRERIEAIALGGES